MRLGGSGRLGHRPATSIRHSAGVGAAHHRARRAGRSLPPAKRLPLHRGARHHADRNDCYLLCRRIDLLPTGPSPPCARVYSGSAYCHQPGDALCQHRHHSGNGHAAQSLPALVDCPDRRSSKLRWASVKRSTSHPSTRAAHSCSLFLLIAADPCAPPRCFIGQGMKKRCGNSGRLQTTQSTSRRQFRQCALRHRSARFRPKHDAYRDARRSGGVMEGSLNIRITPWLRRLITRGIAIIPAVLVIGIFGEGKTTQLLIAAQVVLSMQLGFAVWPLLRFTDEKAKMGEFVNRLWLKILAGRLPRSLSCSM